MTTTGSLPGQRLKPFSRRQRRIASLNIESTLLTELESSRTQFEVLGLEGQFLTLASNLASSRKFLVLDSKTALFFDSLKMGPRSWATLLRLGAHQRTQEKQFLTLVFCEKLANLWAKTFFIFFLFISFFLVNTSALCPWCLASNILALGPDRVCSRKVCPWPRGFLVSLSSSLVSSTPPLAVNHT